MTIKLNYSDRSYMRTPSADPGGELKGAALRRHNERRYREKGWRKGKDGVWRPPPPKSVTGPSTRQYTAYAPDQGGPPPMPGSLQERQNERDRKRVRRRQRRVRAGTLGGRSGPV